MIIHLTHHSSEPLYGQIVEQVKYHVACGRLKPRDRLPSIRRLAGRLGINPRTVVKAYEELRRAGLIVIQHGRGAFIKAPAARTPARPRKKAIARMARRVLSEAARIGAKPDEVLTILAAEARKIAPEKLRKPPAL